jgi:hypothetical protein
MEKLDIEHPAISDSKIVQIDNPVSEFSGVVPHALYGVCRDQQAAVLGDESFDEVHFGLQVSSHAVRPFSLRPQPKHDGVMK